MPYILLVSTPTGKPVRTCLCCLKCQFHIDDRTYESDLIYLPLLGLDLILGMDWLSANHVILDCATKSIVFLSTLVKTVSLSLKPIVLNYCKTGDQEYVLLSASEVDLEQAFNDILVIKDYPEVFPRIFSSFPLRGK